MLTPDDLDRHAFLTVLGNIVARLAQEEAKAERGQAEFRPSREGFTEESHVA